MDEANPNYAEIMDYIDSNPLAVIGTTGEDGTMHAAVVFMYRASHGTVCFVTKNSTRKYKNIIANPQVTLTIFNEKETSTLQASGRAFEADDPKMISYVMKKIDDSHVSRAGWFPPVSKLREGSNVIMGVEITKARLARYGGFGIGSDDMFIEL
ncbi:MAG: pyridoxamine 5'-phosphate oxidase family protein [Candidatus Saccharimonadales bacterium]